MSFWNLFRAHGPQRQVRDADVPAAADHDLGVLFATATSTAWTHVRTCPKCYAPTGHQEFMTQICLTCGRDMPSLPRDAAKRRIVLDGKWTSTIRTDGIERVHVTGRGWVPINERKAASP